MESPYWTPTGRRSHYRYEYRHNPDNNAHIRIFVNDIVIKNAERGQNLSEYYAVHRGNGQNRENPGVWIVSLDTKQQILVHADDLFLICGENSEDCGCERHLQWASYERQGPYGANVVGGQNNLEAGDTPTIDIEPLIEQVRNLTVTNRNKVRRFIEELQN